MGSLIAGASALKRGSRSVRGLSGFDNCQIGTDNIDDTLPLLRAQFVERVTGCRGQRSGLIANLVFGEGSRHG